MKVRVLLVGGGGGGGGVIGGGGGGGGVIDTYKEITPGAYEIVIGTGGIGGRGWNNYPQRGEPGTNTTGLGFVAFGGGAGSAHGGADTRGATSGGSGGGGANTVTTGGASLYGQGTSGGLGNANNGGGGGGAGDSGTDYAEGGDGVVSNITGSNIYYGGGGGGGTRTGYGSRKAGGLGGGGTGSTVDTYKDTGMDGTNGLGGGGGAAGHNGGSGNYVAGNGGSGVFIVAYPLQKASEYVVTGGTVSYSSTHVVRTFTSNGTLSIKHVGGLHPYRRTRIPGSFNQEVEQFSPIMLSGCKLWIDVSQHPVVADGTQLSSMTDLSGNYNDLSQISSGQNPRYYSGVINGLPVIRHTASASSTWHIPWSYAAPNTFFYVAKMNSGTNGRLLSGRSNNWLMGYHGGNMNQAYFNGWVQTSSGTPTDTNPHVWSAIVNSTSYLWNNGTLVKSGTGGTTAPANLCIGYQGTSEFSDGDIGEIIGFDRALSTAERQQVENYLKSKWGIV